MKNIIKDSVLIKGQLYIIKHDDNIEDDAEICPRDKIITIKKSISNIEKNQAYLHEIIHGVMEETGLAQCPSLTEDMQELIAENCSNVIWKLFFE